MRLKAYGGATAAWRSAPATGASAQAFLSGFNGLYVAGDVGYHMGEVEADSTGPGARVNWSFSPDSDWAGFGRIGYQFNENIRLELEGGYRPGDLESIRGTGPIQGLCTPGPRRNAANQVCGPVNGELNASTLMLNAIFDFDFDFGLFGQRLVPFVGAGIGAAEVQNKVFGQLSNIGAPGQPAPAGVSPFQNLVIDDIERAIAYQGILGLRWSCRRTSPWT
jgi:opacity protein-like surface antigen